MRLPGGEGVPRTGCKRVRDCPPFERADEVEGPFRGFVLQRGEVPRLALGTNKPLVEGSDRAEGERNRWGKERGHYEEVPSLAEQRWGGVNVGASIPAEGISVDVVTRLGPGMV